MRARSRYGSVNRWAPEAAARCDRGGEIRRRSELFPEMRWAGARLVPTGFLCCAQHIDRPHPQDRLLVLQPDPRPVIDPRIDLDALAAMPAVDAALLTEAGEWLVTESGEVLAP
jgi:hypothetical protein